MTEIRLLLPQLMAQRRVNRTQLASASGLRYATLSDVYSGKHRPSLETLEAVIQGLEKMTGQPVEITDLLEVTRSVLPLHGDPDRPALSGPLKKFRFEKRDDRPRVTTPSEQIVADLRGRE